MKWKKIGLILHTTVRNISYIPTNRLSGKIAVVTASTDGIGFAISERLAREGAKVVVSSRKQKNVDEAVRKLKSQELCVTGLVCHVSKHEDRKKLYETANDEFGGIDILVSNAGANPSIGAVLDCEEKAWDKVFDVNVKASYLLAKEVMPYIEKRGGGKIVFVSSIGGYQPFEFLGAYSVTKTSVIGLTKAAALQLAGCNINVNAVAPGVIQTKFSKALTSGDVGKDYLSKIPLNRFGCPEDVAAVVAFLVSDDANYITGETIVVAGGMPSRL